MARVVRYEKFGGPEVLRVVDVPTPAPGPGQVLLAVRAAGVNPIDWKLRSGLRASGPLVEPAGTGSDAAGVVVALGPGAEGWDVGDEVVARGVRGAYATHVLVATDQLTEKPASIGFEVAAALPIPVGTAYQALRSLDVGSGDVLLVHAGSGSVGQAAVQLARRWGAQVVATASPGNHARLRELGAVPVAHGGGAAALADRVRAAAPGPVTVVLDAAGTDEALQASFALVPDRRRIGTVVAGARAAELGIRAWSGGSSVPLTAEEVALRAEAIEAVLPWVADGTHSVEVARTFPLDEAAQAQALGESGAARGKIVVLPQA